MLSDEYSNKPFQCTILKTYSFLDIKDGSEHQEMGKPSFMNLVEVKIVMHLIAKLNKGTRGTAFVQFSCRSSHVQAGTP